MIIISLKGEIIKLMLFCQYWKSSNKCIKIISKNCVCGLFSLNGIIETHINTHTHREGKI